MRQFTLVLCLGVSLGCTTDGAEPEIETVYDPCSPLVLAIAPDLGAAERQGVEDAIRAWSRVLPTRLVIGAGAQAPAVLPVHYIAGDALFRAIYWDAIGVVAISRDRLTAAEYGLAIAHELGHAFGLHHIPATDRASVMNVSNLAVAPTPEDAAAVRARWAACGDAAPAVPTGDAELRPITAGD